MFKIKKLFIKMVVFIILPMALTLTLTGYSVNKKVDRSLSSLTNTDLYANSKIAAQETNLFFKTYTTMVEQFAADNTLASLLASITSRNNRIENTSDYGAVLQTMKGVQSLDSNNILFVWAADFDTSQYIQNDGYIADTSWDVTTRPWYKVKETGKTMLVPPYEDTSTGKTIISLVSPVFGPNQAVVGAAGIDLLLDDISENFASYSLGETGFFILCSDDGRAVFHPNTSNIDKSIDSIGLSKEALDLLKNPLDTVIAYTMDGERIHGAVSEVGDTGWVVLTGLPDEEYYKEINTVETAVVFYFIAGVVLIACITLVLAGRITKPLKLLAKNAQQIADGELDLEIKVKTSDEVGLVADSIRNIILRLREYIVYINEISDILNEIAEGNLAFELTKEYIGEFARIKDSLLHISSSLNSTMYQINQTAEQVAEGAEQIAYGAQSLSQGATEQASSTQELEATMSQIAEQISDNAKNAANVREIAEIAKTDVTNSDAYMHEMIRAMEDITEKSSQISRIIKTIDDIAFQTNILALNAAVEAARAGVAGKGFAVVADEVRNLASKSAEAVRTTTELIEGTVKSISKGTQIVNDTADSLQSVVDKVQQIETMIQTIAEACAEQASGAEQVSIGIDQITMVTQTNSAAAEQSAASSEELSGHSQILKGLVQTFKLK